MRDINQAVNLGQENLDTKKEIFSIDQRFLSTSTVPSTHYSSKSVTRFRKRSSKSLNRTRTKRGFNFRRRSRVGKHQLKLDISTEAQISSKLHEKIQYFYKPYSGKVEMDSEPPMIFSNEDSGISKYFLTLN